MKPVW